MLLKKDHRLLADEELMMEVCKGNKTAFEELYARYSKKLLAFLYRMLNRDREKAEDFLQDVFMKIIEKPQQFDPSKKFSTWVYAVAANLCKNEIRNLSTRSRLIEESGIRNEYLQHASDHSGIDHKDFKTALQDIYAQLNEKDRAIFVLRFQHELPLKDIAEILGCPEGTVKSGIYYLLKKLAQKIPHFKPE